MSSGSDSDEEYIPGKPEQLSEEESADEETEKQYEGEVEQKKKRKSVTNGKSNKKRKVACNKNKNYQTECKDDLKQEEETPIDPEEEKKKEDDLWAMFLGETPATTKLKEQTTKKSEEPIKTTNVEKVNSTKDEIKSREARIFEFAGEKIVVEDNVIKEVSKDEPTTLPAAPVSSVSANARPAGISNILDQLNKKTKLSTLEKSKLDWTTFKKKEGIEEEIVTHNKGKAGYLERQDFLERADLRQFEIERDLRTSRRANR